MSTRASIGSWADYLLGALGIGAAFLVREMFVHWIGELPPYITFYPVVFLMAAMGGTGPGLFATLLAGFIADLSMLEPIGHLSIASRADFIGLLLFLFNCSAASVGGGIYRSARERWRKTERALREAELKTLAAQSIAAAAGESEKQRQLLSVTLGSIGDGVIVTDAAGIVTFINLAGQRLTGWHGEEGFGRPLMEVFRVVEQTSRNPVENPIEKVLKTGSQIALGDHVILISRDGRETVIDDNGAPLRDQSGTVRGVALIFRNITEKEDAYKALRESEEHFRLSIDAGSLGTFMHDLKVDWLYCDERSRRHFGVSSDGPLSALVARVHPDDNAHLSAAIADALDPTRNDPRYGVEYRVVDPDGSVRWLRVEAHITFEGQGSDRRAVRSIGTTQDITARRTADDALHASEQRLRLAYDAASAGAWEWDPRTDLTVWSEQAWKLHGLPPSGGNPTREMWRQVVHPDDIEEVERVIASAQYAEREFTAEWRVRDPATGNYRWLLARGRPVRDDTGQVKLYSGIVLDITDRRRVEQALRDSESRLSNIIENLAEGLIVATPVNDDMQLQWNRAALQMHGYAGVADVRRPLHDFVGEFQLSPAEGGPPLVFEQWPISRLARGETIRGWELRVRRLGKEWERIYSYGGTVVHDSAGQLRFVLLTIIDITAHAEAQISLRQAKEHAESAGRAKDHFLAVVSHELRTPLTPVLAVTSELQAREDLPADVRDELQMVRRNVELEARLVDDLLTLTRLHRGKILLHQETVNAHTIIQAVIEQFQTEIQSKRLELSLDLRASESYVWADPTRFQQSLSNLLGNAVKFTPDNGAIAIGTSSQGGKIRIEMSDTGIGIEPDVLTRLFNPFEQGERTVTRKFGGLGLGLSIAKQFIELHGGTLTAASEGAGRGAQFTIELGAVMIAAEETPAPAAPAGVSPETRAWKKRSILLVEDHPDTARILARLLKSVGYSVQTAATVAQALTVADQHPFDILLSDIGLPDGSGCDVVRELRRRRSGIHAIALSGFGQPEDIARSLEAGFADHLIKPVNFERLRNVLASMSTQIN